MAPEPNKRPVKQHHRHRSAKNGRTLGRFGPRFWAKSSSVNCTARPGKENQLNLQPSDLTRIVFPIAFHGTNYKCISTHMNGCCCCCCCRCCCFLMENVGIPRPVPWMLWVWRFLMNLRNAWPLQFPLFDDDSDQNPCDIPLNPGCLMKGSLY